MGGGSYRLLRVFGIDILVHWSWLAIFALLTWWLAQGFFEEEYDWSAGQRWALAWPSITRSFHWTSTPARR